MSNIPADLRYANSHEWVRADGDGVFVVGITEHAQELLGDMVFVETPEVGDNLAQADECGVVESVKAASDIYAPISGEVLAVNEELEDTPEAINNDPYGDGWIYKIKADDETELESLLNADGYRASIEEE